MASVGGYDEMFVDKVDRDLECPICLLALREPLQTCCGHLMCRSCVDRLTTSDEMFRCPLDNIESARNETFLDRIHERKVLSLHVTCRHRLSGCNWIGELRYLEKHASETGDCGYTEVVCPYSNVGCTDKILRRDLSDHLQSQSNQHSFHLLKTVEKLKDDNTYLKLTCEELKRDNEELKRSNAELKSPAQRLSEISINFVWEINDWSKKFQKAKEGENNDLYSSSFYTGYPGYRLCLNLCPNGDNKSGHVSLYLNVMKGDYDRVLAWPFVCKCAFFMIDQESEGRDWSRTFDPLKMEDKAAFQRPNSSQNDGTGWTRFISHRDLQSRCYVKDDLVLIRAEIYFH